ncbi:MerR family transcriptional regulator [Paenibacillus sp. MMO-58]|uniref:MerR family transcriptional regulator n=1 Tax=Paenibacillus sp. MMO-58 TaxID=3081290 RepID=UPI0030169E3B
MNGLSISQVAKEANVNIETVRYYERRGLIPEPPRTESGYRIFTLESVRTIHFIKRAQELGFTLEEIKQLLLIDQNEDNFPIEEMCQFAKSKIMEIEEKVAQLIHFKAILESVSNRYDPNPAHSKSYCQIIQLLSFRRE